VQAGLFKRLGVAPLTATAVPIASVELGDVPVLELPLLFGGKSRGFAKSTMRHCTSSVQIGEPAARSMQLRHAVPEARGLEGNECRDAEPRDYEDRGKLNRRPVQSETGGERDHHHEIADHHREGGDHDAVITKRWRETCNDVREGAWCSIRAPVFEITLRIFGALGGPGASSRGTRTGHPIGRFWDLQERSGTQSTGVARCAALAPS
jgi:hypothetical protein